MMRSLPENPDFTQRTSWVVEALARAGIVGLGPRLWAIVQEAGLRPLGMIGIQPYFGPGDQIGIAFLVESTRVAEPLIVDTGVATGQRLISTSNTQLLIIPEVVAMAIAAASQYRAPKLVVIVAAAPTAASKMIKTVGAT